MAMARGRQRAEWERTAQLSVLIASPNRNPKKHPEPFTMSEFNPCADRRPPPVENRKIKISVECLKGLCKPENQP